MLTFQLCFFNLSTRTKHHNGLNAEAEMKKHCLLSKNWKKYKEIFFFNFLKITVILHKNVI